MGIQVAGVREAAKEHHGGQWSPYVVNGGTCMVIAGKDYCVVGADTRMSLGYNIMSREQPKCIRLTDKCILASAGMQADRDAFQTRIHALCVQYKHTHGHDISTPAIAQLVSTQLYYRRFFPYYAFNLVAGVDENGVGVAYGYDAIGSYQSVPYGVQGSGSALATSLFDNQILCESHPANKKELSADDAVLMIKDAFTSVGERDIYTGDGVDIFLVKAQGTKHEAFPLKMD